MNLVGKVVLAGDIDVSGEIRPIPGFLVSAEREAIRALPTLPMYSMVEVVPVEEMAQLRRDKARLDWLAYSRCDIAESHGEWYAAGMQMSSTKNYPTPRDAIDATMKDEP